MQKSALIELFKILTQDELISLGNFLNSPYFNTNKTLFSLFTLIARYSPDYNSPKLDKQKVRSSLSPGKTLRDGTLRNLMRDLGKLIKKFLIHEQVHANRLLRDRLLFRSVGQRSSKKPFDKLFVSIEDKEKPDVPIDRFYYLNKYLTLDQFYHFPLTERRKIPTDHMHKSMQHLDRFYVLSQLLLKIETNARHHILGESPYHSIFDHAIVEYINGLRENEKPLFALLLLILEAQKTPIPKVILPAISLFREHHKKFSNFDNKMMLKVLINQMNQSFKNGQVEMLRAMHLLYKFGIEKGIMLYDNSLTADDFLNIVTAASRSNKLKWAQQFLRQNKRFLQHNEQEMVGLLSEAIILFDQGNYAEVEKIMNDYNFSRPAYNYRYKHLQIKSYMEIGLKKPKDIDWVLTRLKRVEREIRRLAEKGDREKAQLFLNLLKVLRKILRLRKKEKTINQKICDELIRQHEPLIGKHWLLQRMNDQE